MRRAGWRTMLVPLVPLYAAVIATKHWLLEHGWLSQRRLAHRVVSVGSLSAGGAGKTPVVVMLAEMLAKNGIEVRILTRGYGRTGTAVERVVLHEDGDSDATRFGDEPVMLAKRLGAKASVWVGVDRYAAGVLSERGDSDEKVTYLLDDGFQHRKLARDQNVVLVTRQDIEDHLLPAGNLREPLTALRRADVLVVREEERDVLTTIAARLPDKKFAVLLIRRFMSFAEAVPARVVMFCGLARPESFLEMLATDGIVPVATMIFRDHHPYSMEDMDRLIGLAALHHAGGFVTTEKDAVKLTEAMRERLRSLGVLVVPELGVELTGSPARVIGSPEPRS